MTRMIMLRIPWFQSKFDDFVGSTLIQRSQVPGAQRALSFFTPSQKFKLIYVSEVSFGFTGRITQLSDFLWTWSCNAIFQRRRSEGRLHSAYFYEKLTHECDSSNSPSSIYRRTRRQMFSLASQALRNSNVLAFTAMQVNVIAIGMDGAFRLNADQRKMRAVNATKTTERPIPNWRKYTQHIRCRMLFGLGHMQRRATAFRSTATVATSHRYSCWLFAHGWVVQCLGNCEVLMLPFTLWPCHAPNKVDVFVRQRPSAGVWECRDGECGHSRRTIFQLVELQMNDVLCASNIRQ